MGVGAIIAVVLLFVLALAPTVGFILRPQGIRRRGK